MHSIVTSETRARVDRPTSFGMHAAVAERLRAFGIDPEAHAHEIVTSHHRARPRPLNSAERLALAAQMSGLARISLLELSLDPADVRAVTPLLNQAAMMYEDNNYIADVVAPVQLVPPSQASAQYKIWDRGPFRALLDSRIGPNGSAKEVSPTLSSDTYRVVRRALKSFANNDTELANPSISAGMVAVEQVMELHLVGREYDVATMFHATSNYASGNVKTLTTGSGGTNWLQGSAANPIADLLGLMEKIPGVVNYAVLSDIVWHGIQQNAQIKAILASQFTNQGLLRPQDFSLYFGIPNLLITSADYRDDTGARKRIWSETNLWIGSVNPGRDRRTFARTFRLDQGAGGWVTKYWRDEDRGSNGGAWVRTAYEEDRKIVSSDYGALIVNVIG